MIINTLKTPYYTLSSHHGTATTCSDRKTSMEDEFVRRSQAHPRSPEFQFWGAKGDAKADHSTEALSDRHNETG